MKHHIAVKAAAVFLASLMLFAACVSGISLIFLMGMGLEDSDAVERQHQEEIRSSLGWSAQELAIRYFAKADGGMTDELLFDSYGSNPFPSDIRREKVFYEIRDVSGTILDSDRGNTADLSMLEYRFRVEYPHILAGPVHSLDLETAWEALKPLLDLTPEQSQQAPENGFEYRPVWEEETTALNVYLTSFSVPDQIYAVRSEVSAPVTVTIWLAPGAVKDEAPWALLQMASAHQSQLITVLGISLVLFGILAVYLCCTAGRSPGSREIRPGGLNRLPLDLYFLLAGTLVCTMVALAIEGSSFLMRQGTPAVAAFYGYAGFLCCLLAVGFCFAFAAQIKTPGFFWITNSLCARCCRLGWRCVRWAWSIFRKWAAAILGVIPLILKKCRLLLLTLLGYFRDLLLFLLGFVRKQLGMASEAVNRWYRMLPLTWQWLGAGALMPVILLLGYSTRRAFWVILALGVCGSMVLYGANAYGTLLRSTKRMRGGDLEAKIDEHALKGSFQEFAEELNGLAGVAVVAAQKQLRSERMKTELITNVSHDIKTPLTSIINYVDLLQKPHTPEEEKTYLEILARQSNRMKKLIEDLIEMSKASTGNMTVDIVRIDGAEAVNQALGEFADKFTAADLTVVYSQPQTPMQIYADGRLLWRAMSNILSNAVKYAMPGTRVYVDLSAMDGKVMISVKNISRDQLNVRADELMERFVRGDSSRNTEGSGLGLNIARSLMELQHGSLNLLVDGDLFKVTLVFPEAP